MAPDSHRKKASDARRRLLNRGLKQIPKLVGMDKAGRNGEALATDEAAVWKRVLNYRVARYIKPQSILESHPGIGISTLLYRHAAPTATLSTNLEAGVTENAVFDLIDVDPFGQPWDFLDSAMSLLSSNGVIQISNGEAMGVRRNLKRGQRFPTQYVGKCMPLWVVKEYLPKLEKLTGLKVQYFYAFPSTIRVILSSSKLPDYLWSGCQRWMWWLAKYATRTGL